MTEIVSVPINSTDPRLAGTLILAGAGSWFVIDSTASIAAGAPWNAAYNLIFLAMFVVPVLLGRRTV